MQFLGVDTLDAREGAEGFIAEFGVPFPSLFDPDGVIRTDLDSFGLPVTVFFDAEGEPGRQGRRRASARPRSTSTCGDPG